MDVRTMFFSAAGAFFWMRSGAARQDEGSSPVGGSIPRFEFC
jgi:hypothetical protein